MATGLTFGSIAALFGLTNGFISQQQYSELVTVVILSAIVPTLVAQGLYRWKLVDEEEEEALGAEDSGPVRGPRLGRRAVVQNPPGEPVMPPTLTPPGGGEGTGPPRGSTSDR
jgi:hypothetical protein